MRESAQFGKAWPPNFVEVNWPGAEGTANNERTFNLPVPFAQGVVDFELKAIMPDGTVVWYYHSPAPLKTQWANIYTAKPKVEVTSGGFTDPRLPQVQGDTSIEAMTAGAGVVSIRVTVTDTVSSNAKWVCAFMRTSGFLEHNGETAWWAL